MQIILPKFGNLSREKSEIKLSTIRTVVGIRAYGRKKKLSTFVRQNEHDENINERSIILCEK
jgi:hypothetical protein